MHESELHYAKVNIPTLGNSVNKISVLGKWEGKEGLMGVWDGGGGVP